VLPLIIADRAMGWRSRRGGVLRPASSADEVIHGILFLIFDF
jgi:hypothetical protein